jgi:hypothetical protein
MAQFSGITHRRALAGDITYNSVVVPMRAAPAWQAVACRANDARTPMELDAWATTSI